MSEPRRHHYLPVTYLAGFASSRGSLSVIGVDGRRRTASPQAVGFENGLYRVDDVNGVEPNDFEKDFANLEGAYTSVLRNVDDSKQLPHPSSSQFRTLIDFLVLILARGPALRDGVNRTVRDFALAADREVRSSPESFSGAVAAARKSGADVPDDPALWEQARQLEFGKDFTIHIPNTFFMQALFRAVEVITPVLSSRSWELLTTDGPEFVTCDRPVGITLNSPKSEHGRERPDYRAANTVITFPLNRRLLLFGSVKVPPSRGPSPAESIDGRAVASLNSRTISMANRFICWSGGQLLWMTKKRNVGDADQLVEAFLAPRSTDIDT